LVNATGLNLNGNTYLIESDDLFEEKLYPAVVAEVSGLYDRLHEIRERNKIEIVISFLKYHSIKSAWLERNKEVTSVLTSRHLKLDHLESLFSACKNNLPFCVALEDYIKNKLAQKLFLKRSM
jgi:hypothetical protein